MSQKTDPARLEILKTQRAQAANASSALSIALLPIREQRDRLAEQLGQENTVWQNSVADAHAIGVSLPGRPPKISSLIAELEEVDGQIMNLEEEKKSYREAASELSTLISACSKFLENIDD